MFIINTDCMIIICIIENIGFLKILYNYYRTVASYMPIYIYIYISRKVRLLMFKKIYSAFYSSKKPEKKYIRLFST